jgi:hypothetical protein
MSTASIASRRPPARARSVRWALARVEGRRLLAHPLFALGMATSLAAIALANSDATERSVMLAGDCFVLFGGAVWTFLVACLAAGRERRDHAHDFYAAQPVTARVRTEATLLSLGCAGVAGAALIAVATIALAGPDGTINMAGQRYTLHPLDLVQGPLYLVLAGAFGILVGSWTRHVYAALLAALVLFVPPVALLPWYVFHDIDSRGFYGAVPVGAPDNWHLVRLAGLAALAAAGALARHDRRPRVALLALMGLGAALAGAVSLGPQSRGLAP